MVSEHHLSERRACRLVGLSRDSYRHARQADQATQEQVRVQEQQRGALTH